jgi:hypothetical protein
MALSFGSRAALNQARDQYQISAKKRRHVKVMLGPKHDGTLRTIAWNAERAGGTPRAFVAANFAALSEEFCLRTWHSTCPPLGIFVTEGARHRFRRFAHLSDLEKAQELDRGAYQVVEVKDWSSNALAVQLWNDHAGLLLAAHNGFFNERTIQKLVDHNKLEKEFVEWLSSSSGQKQKRSRM